MRGTGSRSAPHCIEYAKLLLWEKERPGQVFDPDIEEHMRWVYDKALARAQQYGIQVAWPPPHPVRETLHVSLQVAWPPPYPVRETPHVFFRQLGPRPVPLGALARAAGGESQCVGRNWLRDGGRNCSRGELLHNLVTQPCYTAVNGAVVDATKCGPITHCCTHTGCCIRKVHT
jgi:hypothetical protein